MRIKILTVGTRGDVQPFLALAKGLQARGHEVTLCTGSEFKGFIESNGVAFSPIRADYLELTQSETGKKMLSGNPIAIMKSMKTVILPMMEHMLEDFWESAQDAEVLIYHPKAFGGYDIAEKLAIPAFIAHPDPLVKPTGAFTNPAFPIPFRSTRLNKASFRVNRSYMLSFAKLVNDWRKHTLGLPTKRSFRTDDTHLNGKALPVLYGCSPSVIPFDSSWNDAVSMEGFWFLEEESGWEPSPELLSFLDEGAPPIAVSFSSMPLKNPDSVYVMLQEALRETGQRGILITGSSGMKSTSADPNLFEVAALPHSWLFPKAKAIIHHGGAGTTAAALRAGRPMIICPFTGDQPFWARRMQEMGVAVDPLKEKDMSVDAFASRIREVVENDSFQRQAALLSKKITQEKGVADTVQFIEEKILEHTSF